VAVDLSQVANVETEPGELPKSMAAWVIREERQGEPTDAFQVEEIEVPEPGAFEVIVRVMAAGVNFNSIWAALGEPVSIFAYGDHPRWGHHIAGSDASGIVWKVGAGVRRWKPGDEVVLHANQASYEDPEVHGLDPLAAPSQLGWGYQTTWGSFAQFAKVQAQQLLPKPTHLSWVDCSAYGVTYFTAYRMLIDRCGLGAGDNVLIWGAAGGMGVFATQLCAVAGARAVGVVSSAEKGRLVRELGAVDYVDRREFGPGDGGRFVERVAQILGDAPDIVFEHVGKDTFPLSVAAVKRFGKVVTCGATSGYMLALDGHNLVNGQKQIIGSHAANAYECWRANQLIIDGSIRPVLWRAMRFDELPEAHRLLHENRHVGKLSIVVGARDEQEGSTGAGPGAIWV